MKFFKKVMLGILTFFAVFGGIFGILFAVYGEEILPDAPNVEPVIGGQSHPYNIYEVNKRTPAHTLDTMGDANILVIPVSFTDYESKSTEKNRKLIETTFFGKDGDTKWESVSTFYRKSSGGKLNISGTVTDWFDCGMTTKEMKSHTNNIPGYIESGEDGTWYLLDKAIQWYESTPDANPNAFDKDKDGYYDLVWLVYNAPYHTSTNRVPSSFWAFTYWNLNNAGKHEETGKQYPLCYCFASMDFMFNGYGDYYLDSHTFVHETGHALGLNDYYCTTGTGREFFPFGCVDMMDYNIGDHCSFSKYLMGWISPKEVISDTKTFTMKSTAETGDFYLVSENFGGSPFDEYFLIEYITPTGLNYLDYTHPYRGNNLQGYSKPGIRISHVDSRGIHFTDNNKGYLTNNFNLIDVRDITNSTTLSYYRCANGYAKENTIMQKDYTNFSTSVLGNKYDPRHSDPLFYAGETFSLEPGSKYCNLMPSGTNEMNNKKIFNFTITVDEISKENGATITVKKS